MPDTKLWRQEGPKAFLEFLSNATGEDHDAAVYDTKLEFDASNDAAVRYVASVAMTKASETGETFSEPMPENGSVLPCDREPDNARMKEAYRQRKEKEQSVRLYLPDADAYSEAAINAVSLREIPESDMTEDELAEKERERNKADRTVVLGYLFCALLVCGWIVWMLNKLSGGA